MAVPKRFIAPMVADNFYHVYNRTNNKEKLFLNDGNRRFFLRQYAKYLSPYVRTYAYNLLDNHFHLLVRVRSLKEILEHLATVPEKKRTQKERALLKNPDLELSAVHFIEWQFLRFFTSYSMGINKSTGRKGNLFHRPFKRVLIKTDSQFMQVLLYIHLNAVKHRVVEDFRDHPWSSYKSYLSEKSTLSEKSFLLNWMGGVEAFIKSHLEFNKMQLIDLSIEDG